MAKTFNIEEVNKESLNVDLKQECENLLFSSCYDSESKYSIEQQIEFYSEEELNELKSNLLVNQIDRIAAGHNYSMRDIHRKLDNES